MYKLCCINYKVYVEEYLWLVKKKGLLMPNAKHKHTHM